VLEQTSAAREGPEAVPREVHVVPDETHDGESAREHDERSDETLGRRARVQGGSLLQRFWRAWACARMSSDAVLARTLPSTLRALMTSPLS